MKRDLKLNMSHLDAISRKVQSYIDAMEAVGLAARKFEQTIKDQDSDAYNKLSEQWETNVWENEKILKYRLGVIKYDCRSKKYHLTYLEKERIVSDGYFKFNIVNFSYSEWWRYIGSVKSRQPRFREGQEGANLSEQSNNKGIWLSI